MNMASVNSPRGLILAKKIGSGSNSTGIRTIDVNVSPKVASALIPNDIFTGDIIHIDIPLFIPSYPFPISMT